MTLRLMNKTVLAVWLNSPADKCCDDDTPGSAAAICIGLIVTFLALAAKPDGIEEQEKEVQGQTGECQTSQ